MLAVCGYFRFVLNKREGAHIWIEDGAILSKEKTRHSVREPHVSVESRLNVLHGVVNFVVYIRYCNAQDGTVIHCQHRLLYCSGRCSPGHNDEWSGSPRLVALKEAGSLIITYCSDETS
jgi:hypothetical protein